MTMQKLPSNKFTKRTDAHFMEPSKFIKVFLNKLFENKKNWVLSDFNLKNKSKTLANQI